MIKISTEQAYIYATKNATLGVFPQWSACCREVKFLHLCGGFVDKKVGL